MQALSGDSVCSSTVNWFKSSILQDGNAARKISHHCINPFTSPDHGGLVTSAVCVVSSGYQSPGRCGLPVGASPSRGGDLRDSLSASKDVRLHF